VSQRKVDKAPTCARCSGSAAVDITAVVEAAAVHPHPMQRDRADRRCGGSTVGLQRPQAIGVHEKVAVLTPPAYRPCLVGRSDVLAPTRESA
jgi:hypothetical protein